ncbi:hypothetical protein SAMN04487968_11134 [Nocardioides terrae]|uniref:Uncharacterized protein n=1 Tax=Nocardioides terrae TaxID=574651 RepID=A0A1I1LV04_9ACTN|nr:hypothetical protein [Nocardioides terrae]SFC77057.1 hypothetical protein SAMN04487968_11134 [Nocardioides terrae]
MSETSDEKRSTPEHDPDTERQEIADVDEELDARAEGDGLAAEAGRGEEMGLSEG